MPDKQTTPTRSAHHDGPKRPSPRPATLVPTVFLDLSTAAGVTTTGETVHPVLGGRRTKQAILVDLLNTALTQRAERLILCGDLPTDPNQWMRPRNPDEDLEHFLPGWTERGLHPQAINPTGRYQHQQSGHKIEVSIITEWFPGHTLTPTQAQWCYMNLAKVVAKATNWHGWPLLARPSSTGINLWKKTAPTSYGMERIPDDLGRLIKATSPQHRDQHFVAGPSACDCTDCIAPIAPGTGIDQFVYIDGRFMYHGVVTGELGAAPISRLEADAAAELFRSNPYWPARYRVTFTVPEEWDSLGLLPVKRDPLNPTSGWHYPNRPGSSHDTWVDASELRLAQDCGWENTARFEIHEALKLSKANSLQPFARAIDRMLGLCEEWWPGSGAGETIADAVKSMFRVTIGTFGRRRALTTVRVRDDADVPADVESWRTIRDEKTGDIVEFEYTVETHEVDPDSWHPEIAARVWALARTRVLLTPIATPDRPELRAKGGALDIDPTHLIGIQGDAIFTSTLPQWALPTSEGGGDDGRTGRLRLKGVLPGPLEVPATRTDRGRLALEAQAATPAAERESGGDDA